MAPRTGVPGRQLSWVLSVRFCVWEKIQWSEWWEGSGQGSRDHLSSGACNAAHTPWGSLPQSPESYQGHVIGPSLDA